MESRFAPAIAGSNPRAAAAPMLAVLALGLGLLGILFYPECHAAVSTWNASTAYGHCYLVLPMALFLAWERRRQVPWLAARPQPSLALLAVPVSAAWLLSERLGIMEGRQLAALAGVEVLFLVVLGWRLFYALLGPLLYLVFLVPFGAFLTPALQSFTARFTVLGLNLAGIPNFSDDLIIEIPAGVFYVAEACAGLRFLIAAIAFGVFYALLNYRSPVRRVAFILVSIVVPIVANGIRAWGIVVLGHVLGSAEAAAADHVIYGWVFFSIVMLLLVAAGLPLRELPATAPPMERDEPASVRSPIWAAAAACLLIAAGPAVARVLDLRATAVPLLALPAFVLPDGCVRAEADDALPTTRASRTFQCGGQVWNVVLETFPARSTATALIAERRRATGELGAESTTSSALAVSGSDLGAWTLVQTYDPFRTTAFAIWIDGVSGQSGLAGRLHQAMNSVLGSSHAAVLMSVGTPLDGRLPPARQRALVEGLTRIIEAQSGLTAQIERLSRTGR